MKELGVAEPESNLYHWFEKRSTIFEKFADKKLRKLRSVSSGQKSCLLKAEAAVKRMIEDKRKMSLRVSKRGAKNWLRETAQQLEPNQASKLKLSTYCISIFFRCLGDHTFCSVTELSRRYTTKILQQSLTHTSKSCLSLIPNDNI